MDTVTLSPVGAPTARAQLMGKLAVVGIAAGALVVLVALRTFSTAFFILGVGIAIAGFWARYQVQKIDDKVTFDKDRPTLTKLAHAVQQSNAQRVRFLLFLGANPNCSMPPYDRVLYGAAYRGSLPIVQALLNAGAEANYCEKLGGGAALHIAAEKAHFDVVGALLKHPGINIAIGDGQGRTALVVAEQAKRVSGSDQSRLDKVIQALNPPPTH